MTTTDPPLNGNQTGFLQRVDLAVLPFSGEAIFVEVARPNVDPIPGTHKPFLVAQPQSHFGCIDSRGSMYPLQINGAFDEGSSTMHDAGVGENRPRAGRFWATRQPLIYISY